MITRLATGFTTKAVLNVDIANFSLREGQKQMEAIDILILMLEKSIPEEDNDDSGRIWSPAGDGGALTFWNSIKSALDTALSLGIALKEYNRGEFSDLKGRKLAKPSEPLELRMGIHHGPVAKKIDFDGRTNIWGDGMNMSARVLSLGKPNQLLVSETFYENYRRSYSWQDLEVTRIGKWWAKHQTPIVLYNVYSKNDNVGLPPEEVEEWFGPFHFPLEQATRIYEAMADHEVDQGKAFRAAVLAKRLLDLNPQHRKAKKIIESISTNRINHPIKVGQKILHDAFFSPLSPSALNHFFDKARFEVFDKGETIASQGDKADSMMMVVSGEIHPYISNKRITELREGEVIGEMGLFNPAEKRTATLKAFKRTITLSVEYRHLRLLDVFSDPEENKKRQEILDQIWRYYISRTMQNQINASFESLSNDQRSKLFDHQPQFLPIYNGKEIELTVEEVWNSWIIVVSGGLLIKNLQGETKEYNAGKIIGQIRITAGEESPYTEVKVLPNTHLIVLPWNLIKDLLDESEDFRTVTFQQAWGDSKFFLTKH